jgi:hypothetical protein
MSYSTRLARDTITADTITDSQITILTVTAVPDKQLSATDDSALIHSSARAHSPEQRQRDDRRDAVAHHAPVNCT